ncbi:MAG: hypothetical protein QW670_05290 [Candidatus Bathyarchaeia archaeon]
MQQKIKKFAEKLSLSVLLGISIWGFTIQTFILKTGIALYLLAIFATNFLFASALKNLKHSLLCMFAAVLAGVLLAWITLILPPLMSGESVLVSFTTEVYSYYIARYILFGLPVMLIGVLLGSIFVDAI